jgi:hypothetical protein
MVEFQRRSDGSVHMRIDAAQLMWVSVQVWFLAEATWYRTLIMS